MYSGNDKIRKHFIDIDVSHQTKSFLVDERNPFMVINDQMTQGSKVSSPTVSVKIVLNIPVLVTEGLKNACCCMMTSSDGNIFRVTGHLCGEFTGPRWIPHTKASDAELWCFLWSASEYMVEYTIVRLVIWDAILPIMTSQEWNMLTSTLHNYVMREVIHRGNICCYFVIKGILDWYLFLVLSLLMRGGTNLTALRLEMSVKQCEYDLYLEVILFMTEINE